MPLNRDRTRVLPEPRTAGRVEIAGRRSQTSASRPDPNPRRAWRSPLNPLLLGGIGDIAPNDPKRRATRYAARRRRPHRSEHLHSWRPRLLAHERYAQYVPAGGRLRRQAARGRPLAGEARHSPAVVCPPLLARGERISGSGGEWNGPRSADACPSRASITRSAYRARTLNLTTDRRGQKPLLLQGFSPNGAPRFELGTSSPPGC